MQISRVAEIVGHSAAVYSLDFDGTYIYTASADKYVTRWNPYTTKQDGLTIKFDFPVYSLSLLKNKNHLIAGLNTGDIHIFDIKKRKEIKFYKQHLSAVFCICVNHSRGQWYSADADGNIGVWSIEDHSLLALFPFNCGKIRRLTLNTDGSQLAVACQDGTIRLIETLNFNELKSIHAHKDGASSVVFDPFNVKRLWSGGKDGMMRIWDLNSNTLIKEFPAHNYVIYDLIASSSGEFIFSASRDKTIKVWDVVQQAFIARIDLKSSGHRHSVNALCLLNEDLFASASDDKRIKVWGVL
jgi:WD40 repeat protein